jgi:hypothetical protein
MPSLSSSSYFIKLHAEVAEKTAEGEVVLKWTSPGNIAIVATNVAIADLDGVESAVYPKSFPASELLGAELANYVFPSQTFVDVAHAPYGDSSNGTTLIALDGSVLRSTLGLRESDLFTLAVVPLTYSIASSFIHPVLAVAQLAIGPTSGSKIKRSGSENIDVTSRFSVQGSGNGIFAEVTSMCYSAIDPDSYTSISHVVTGVPFTPFSTAGPIELYVTHVQNTSDLILPSGDYADGKNIVTHLYGANSTELVGELDWDNTDSVFETPLETTIMKGSTSSPFCIVFVSKDAATFARLEYDSQGISVS